LVTRVGYAHAWNIIAYGELFIQPPDREKLACHQISVKTTTAEGVAILPRVNADYGDL
jgi:hypothetical protein